MEKFISGLTLPPSRTGSDYEVAPARLPPNPARRPFDRTDHLIQSWGSPARILDQNFWRCFQVQIVATDI
jgi:hypothetical protein